MSALALPDDIISTSRATGSTRADSVMRGDVRLDVLWAQERR